MARAGSLKVFRTPIGFHDAYVAAPSQKAALEAWGADSNLFASGSAERVEDPELMREPLAKPGQVVRRLRGTLAEHMAALPKKATAPPTEPERSQRRETDRAGSQHARPAKPKPRPSRTALDRAKAALAGLESKHAEARAELAQRQAELDRARRTLEAKQESERDKLQNRLDAARDEFEQALRAWRVD